MKEITHTGRWPEPIVLALKVGRGTAHRNILVGETQDLEDSQISPEIKQLEKRGHVVLKDKPTTNESKSPPPPVETSEPEPEEEMTPEEIAQMEAELLAEDGADAVSNEEA